MPCKKRLHISLVNLDKKKKKSFLQMRWRHTGSDLCLIRPADSPHIYKGMVEGWGWRVGCGRVGWKGVSVICIREYSFGRAELRNACPGLTSTYFFLVVLTLLRSIFFIIPALVDIKGVELCYSVG